LRTVTVSWIVFLYAGSMGITGFIGVTTGRIQQIGTDGNTVPR
jgi:hypothetical protein